MSNNMRNEVNTYLNKLFWENMKKAYGGSTYEEMKRNLFELVWKELKETGEDKPPILLNPEKSEFINLRRIKKIVFLKYMGEREAKLYVKKDGFVVAVNEKLKKYPLRMRTCIAHEIGHTYMFDVNRYPMKSYIPVEELRKIRDRDERALVMQKGDWEKLALELERNILIPTQLLKKQINKRPSIDSFLKLRYTFRTTYSLLASRLIQDGFWDACIFLIPCKIISSNPVQMLERWNYFKSEKTFKHFKLEILELRRILSNRSEEVPIKFGGKCYILESKVVDDWLIGLLKLYAR